MPTLRNLSLLGAAALWMAFVFYLSSKPDPLALIPWRPDIIPPAEDVAPSILPAAAHFIEYFVMASLLRLAMGNLRHGAKLYLAAFLICLGFALSDEFHQQFTPQRDSSLADLVIDTAGIAAALISLRLVQGRRAAHPSG